MRTTDHPAIQRSVSASDLAHRLTRALAAKDAVGLQALFGSDVDFKGLTPGQLWEARTADALVNDVILGSWFEPTDVIQLIDSVQHSQIGARIRIGYRLYVQNSGGTFIAEQQVFCDLTDGLITWLRILCSGFIAVTEPGAHATADSQDTHVEGSES